MTDEVWSAAFSPDGKRIVTASDDKTARIWDAATGKPIGEPLKGHEELWSARRSAPTASASSPRPRTRRRGSGTPRPAKPIGEPLKGHDGAVTSAAFSPDGRRIVTASSGQDGADLGRRDRRADRRAAQGP